MILARYLKKEILINLVAIMAILLFVALSNKFAVILAKAASGKLPGILIFKIVALYIPHFIAFLLPLSFFIAILFALGRLYADSEMAVLLSSGIGFDFLVKQTLKLAFILSLLVAVLTIWIVPGVNEAREQAIAAGQTQGILHAITPGQFQTFNDGKFVFYVEDIDDKTDIMNNVFISRHNHTSNQNAVVITAKTANLKQSAGEYYLILYDGQRYSGIPGNADFSVVEFKEYGQEIMLEKVEVPSHEKMRSTKYILGSDNLDDKAELQWRVSIPLSIFILGVLAVGLSKVNPRQGRFAKLLPAILIYIAYYNVLTIAKRWIEDATAPVYIGVWWVHIIFLGLGIVLVLHASGKLNLSGKVK